MTGKRRGRMGLGGILVCLAGAAMAMDDAEWTELTRSFDDIAVGEDTVGLAVAMIDDSGRVHHYLAGLADQEKARPVELKTSFRIGSISKLFVALAVMQLVERGQLALDDRLVDLAPEITFDNPWAPEHPVTVDQLLEHTTGWDAPHFAELAERRESPATLLDALAVHPHSRRSRWVPGSRTAYNNTGPTVAAYLVEKVSGRRFEQQVRETLLEPMGMANSDYFRTEAFRSDEAVGYRQGRPVPYWHLTDRPAGAMHSSLADMTRLLRVLLARGAGVVSPASLAMMERPYGSLAARRGMELGYGLGTVTMVHGDVVYHGHEGALPGSRSLLAYAPELAAGHVVLSTGDGSAVSRIHRLLAAAESALREPGPPPPERALAPAERQLAGYYRSISPPAEVFAPFARLLPWRLQATSDRVLIGPLLGGPPRALSGAGPGVLRQAGTGAIALVAAEDPLVGPVLHYGPMALEKISAVSAWLPVLVAGLWTLLALLALAFALVWVPRLLVGRLPLDEAQVLRLWPLLAVLSLLGLLLTGRQVSASVQPFELVGRVTGPSLLICLASLAFAIFSLCGIVTCIGTWRRPIPIVVRWHSSALAALNAVVTTYLLMHGWIGIALWA